MQRATGQYDHLARVPRTGPRQSRSRRPLTARHRCRATPRRARGMDPTVRNPRIETAIATPWGSKTALFASQDFQSDIRLFFHTALTREAARSRPARLKWSHLLNTSATTLRRYSLNILKELGKV